MKDYIRRWVIRFEMLWRVFFTDKHWIYIEMTSPELVKLLQGEDGEVTILHVGHRKYTVMKIIECLNRNIDKDEMILRKAEFEAMALHEEDLKSNQNK